MLTDKLSRAMQVSSYKAGRLVMTESAYFAAEARRDCFKALEVERYEIIGTLDTSTCSVCGDLDGRVFRQADYEPGVTAPPFHPNCRCTTAPYFDDWEELGAAPSRAARDENNRTVQVRDMTYEEWKKQTSEAEQEYRKIETEEQSAVPGDALEKSLVRYRTAAYAEQHRRKIGEQGQEIIDKPTYNKLTKDFLKHGGLIIRGEEAVKHLERQGAYASYFMGGNFAFIRDDATVSDVLEEMYHALQDRKNMFSECSQEEMLIRREIDAQKYLISVAERYKIPIEETKVTEQNLANYEEQLRERLNGEEGLKNEKEIQNH